MYYELISLVCVAALWGGTNPLIKKNSKGIIKVKGANRFIQFLLELKFLATNITYLVPMFINQMGSVLYFLTLQNVDLSLSVPVANSLTFVFTAIVGCILGEKLPNRDTCLGIILIILGTIFCCRDKLEI
ncbi:transmembrane protein 234 homolog [Aethina tumida]|uniref:transmembrane protein 234 homolog n=1 Tax=Aethina tumida TaxID=116153 RepID=UPI00096B6336|nr:transmembrane protein 234 homolog [Aethina tumida]